MYTIPVFWMKVSSGRVLLLYLVADEPQEQHPDPKRWLRNFCLLVRLQPWPIKTNGSVSYESVHLDSFDHNLVESNLSSSICVFPTRRRSGKSPSSLDPRRRTAAGIGRRSSYVLRLSSSTHTKKLTMVRSCEAFALHQSISVTLSSHKMTGKHSLPNLVAVGYNQACRQCEAIGWWLQPTRWFTLV